MFKFLWYLTGGRPMKRLSYEFTDQITGEPVYYWRDKLGRKWMATVSDWFFRVPSET
jgi:hypothetical protein